MEVGNRKSQILAKKGALPIVCWNKSAHETNPFWIFLVILKHHTSGEDSSSKWMSRSA